MERIHRIIKEQFCTSQEGYCGGNIIERPENLKIKIKNGNIETEMQLREAFEDYADNVFNVAEYGGDEPKYKGMTALEVWKTSADETSIRYADESVLNILMLRNNGFQTVQRDGVFIWYHGGKIWYYDEKTTWKYLKQKVCVRYDGNNPSEVRLYDTEDRYLCTWKCADWLITEYFNESKETLAELGRQKANFVRQVRGRIDELKGNKIKVAHGDGIRAAARQNKGKFILPVPKNIIPVTILEALPKAVGAEEIGIEINLHKMAENQKKRKEN